MTFEAQIESVLFFRGEPVSLKDLSKIFGKSEEEMRKGIEALKGKLAGGGLAIVEAEGGIELRTSPEASSFLERLRKEDLEGNLGKAGLETLAIILYKGPLTRSEIDYIRGVNSTFILRNLLMRGLVERIPNPKDERSFLYQGTTELLSMLGVRSKAELPEYEKAVREIEGFLKREENKPEHGTDE